MARCDPSHQSKPHNFNTIVTLFNIIETLFYTVYHTLLVLRHCRQLVVARPPPLQATGCNLQQAVLNSLVANARHTAPNCGVRTMQGGPATNTGLFFLLHGLTVFI
jgi:hypothetical protein